MISIEEIKEYTRCPQFGDKNYGKWGSLRIEQRVAYRHLIDIIEGMEQKIERLQEENKKYNKWIESLNKDNHRLQNIIKEVREYAGELRLYDNESIEFEISNDLFRILDKVSDKE